MKKSVRCLWLIAMAILLALPFPIYNLMKNNIDTENHENRVLAEKPEFDLLTIKDYPAAYDDWMNDNLPFRNQLVTANSMISYFIFDEPSGYRVILGKDNWLFYNHRDPIADYQGTNLYSHEELEEVRANVLDAKEKLEERGIEFVIFIAPNKEQVYSEYMPDSYGEPAEYTRVKQVCDYLKDDVRIVYALDDIMEAKEDYPEYVLYKYTDTHWNNLGAYVGAKALMSELGYELPEISEISVEEVKLGCGDLADLMNISSYVDDINYDIHYSSNSAERLENTDGCIRYSTEGAEDRKIMVIRDSFGTALGEIMSSQFDEYVMYHKDYYEPYMIDEEQPDVVVFECVERFVDLLRTYPIVE